jgi:hypothetical protein
LWTITVLNFVLFCWYWWNWWPSLFKTFFCFVDIGGIVDHHCFNFLLFCWYWWNCWPSLFKLSFHNRVNKKKGFFKEHVRRHLQLMNCFVSLSIQNDGIVTSKISRLLFYFKRNSFVCFISWHLPRIWHQRYSFYQNSMTKEKGRHQVCHDKFSTPL